jgi:tetratricopeptide (TPR) repeat protein
VAFTILHQAMELAIDTSPSEDKIKTLLLISHEFFNQGEKEISSNIIKELLNDVRGFSKIILRISALCDIYLEMLLQSVEKEYDEVKIEFFSLAFSMESEYWKCKALNVIYCKLSGQGKLEVYNKVLNDLMYFADNIGDVDSKHTVLIELTRDFCSQGMLEIAEFVIQKALYLTEQMDCSTKKNKALRDISTEFARLGNVGDSISCAQSVSIDEDEEIKPPFAINALELVKIKKVDGALLCIDEISDPSVKCVALISISNELESQNNKALASELLGDAISCANRISDEFYRSRAYESIICALRSQRKFEDAISLLVKINHEETKYRELMLIFSELYFIGKKEEAIDLLLHSISVQSISCNESDKMWTLINICEELVNQGKVDLAFLCAKAISDRDQKFQTLRFISSKIIIEYSEEKEFMVMQEVNELIRSSNSESWMVRALLDLTDDLSKQEKSESALSKLNEAIEITRLIKDDEDRDSLMQSISFEIYKQNNLQDALKYIRGMSSPYHKTFSVLEIVQHLIENENKKVASSVIFGAHVYAREIIQDWYKDAALSALSSKYVRLGMLDKAYSSIMSMHENDDKNRSLFTFCSELIELGEIEYAISLEQRISKKSDKIQLKLMISSKCFKQGEKEKSYFFLQKAISSAHELRNIYEKNESFLKICMELFNQGKVSEAIVNSGIILNDSLKIDFLLKVSRDLHNQKMFESASLVINEAFLCVRDFFEETDIQISSFIKVADELKNQGNREMAMTVLRQAINDAMRIIDVDEKNYAFTHISVTLASRFGDWDLSEQIGLAITQISEKQDCFRQIANCAIANHSPLELLVISNHFKSNKAQHYFLRGWLENIKEIDCDKILILSSLRKFLNDPQAIEELLYKYALYKIFFDDSEIEENQLINSRIDIQWAIDVKQMA